MDSRPVYRCRRAKTPPQLDGSAWEGCEEIDSAFHLVGSEASRSASYLRAAAMWDHRALYVSYVSDPSPVPVTKQERDADLFNECAVELFLRAGDGYYEIEINPLGAVLDLYFPDVEEQNWQEMAKFDVAGMRWEVGETGEADRWWAQAALPWEGLPLATRGTSEGDPCVYGNFARSQTLPSGGYDLTTWSHAQEVFCELDRMGTIVLMQ